MDSEGSMRDAKGKFLKGHPGGPGRPKGVPGRQTALRRAVEDAVTPDHLAGIMRRITRMALEGNLTAAKIALDRACGKAPESAATCEPLGVDLPKLQTAADCTGALDTVIAAICAGTIDANKGKLLVEAIQVRLKGIETQELEKRLAALEESAAMVDLGRGRRG